MNTIEEKLVLAIEKGITAAESTGDFVLDNAPKLIKQFIIWRYVRNIVIITMCPVVLYLSYLIIPYLIKDIDSVLPIIVFIIVGAIFLCSYVIECIFDLIKLIIAPKIYIIDYYISAKRSKN